MRRSQSRQTTQGGVITTVALPIIRTSERTTFKRCVQRWQWSYREGLKPQGPPNRNLWFGTGIHLALAEWYGTGVNRLVHPLETWEEYCTGEMHQLRAYFDRGDGIESEWMDACELGKIILAEYLKEYGDDEQWDFIAVERSGNLRVRGPSGDLIARYAYTYDGVYRDLSDGRIKLLETKTAATITTAHLTLDDQAGSYWATASAELRKTGHLGDKDRIAGVNYNFLRKALPDDRPRDPATGERCNKPTKDHNIAALEAYGRTGLTGPALRKLKADELSGLVAEHGLTVRGEISASQPTPNFLRHMVPRTSRERNTQIRRIGAEAAHMQVFRDGTLTPTKTPRSTGHDACHYGCEFFLMCELQEAGADWEQYRDAMYRVADPYADHRKSAHAAS